MLHSARAESQRSKALTKPTKALLMQCCSSFFSATCNLSSSVEKQEFPEQEMPKQRMPHWQPRRHGTESQQRRSKAVIWGLSSIWLIIKNSTAVTHSLQHLQTMLGIQNVIPMPVQTLQKWHSACNRMPRGLNWNQTQTIQHLKTTRTFYYMVTRAMTIQIKEV